MYYEKKYREALERARKRVESNEGYYSPKELCEEIFPELFNEDEDERIRKGIIRNLKYLLDKAQGFVKDDLEERIAWLEKQKPRTLEQAANIFLDALSKSPYNNIPITDAQTITKHLLNFLQNPASYNPDALIGNDQNPAWSEEDEERLESCLVILTRGIKGITEKTINTEWLRSLKQRVGWKPTKEQMEAMETLITHIIRNPLLLDNYTQSNIRSLCNDLRKLK